MHTIRIDYPAEWDTVNIYAMADWHIGDLHSVQHEIDSHIRDVLNDPHGLTVLNGDLLNTAVKSSVSDIYSEQMKPMDQILYLTGLLKPIRDRIIGVTCGNHEARIYRNDGVDIMRIVCRELDIEDKYGPDGVLIFLRFGQVTGHKTGQGKQKKLFTIYATHGTGGGRKEGAKAIRLADMAAVVDADVYIHSHSHLPMSMKKSFYRVNAGNSSVQEVVKAFANTGAALEYGGYSQSNEYSPAARIFPVIHLCAKKGRADITL